MNLALAAAIGLGLGLVAAFLAENFSKAIAGPEQIEREIGERYLAVTRPFAARENVSIRRGWCLAVSANP